MLKSNPWLKSLLILAVFLLLGYLLWNLKTLIVYVLISGVLSIVANPLITFLDKIKLGKFKIPRSLSAIVSLVVIWLAVFGLLSILIPIVSTEIRVLSSLDYEAIWRNIEGPLSAFEEELRNYGVLTGSTKEGLESIKSNALDYLALSNVTDIFASLINGLGNVFVAFFSISFITFFFLKEDGLFVDIIMQLVPTNYKSQAQTVLAKSKKLLARYFIGVFIQVTAITILVGVGLSIVGVKNAWLIAIFAGIINVIPYIGPFIGSAVGILLVFTAGLDSMALHELLPIAGQSALVFLIVQLSDNIIFQPFIFSNSVNAHPLEIFLVISIAGTLGGVTSMILAIPAYTFLRIVAKEFLSEFRIVQNLTDNI